VLCAQLAVYFHELAAPLFRAAASGETLQAHSASIAGLVNLGGWVASSGCPQLQAAWGSLLNVGPAIVGAGASQQGQHPLLMRTQVGCRGCGRCRSHGDATRILVACCMALAACHGSCE
jgi:hypothetical protein